MKKILLLSLVCLMFAATAFAQDTAPKEVARATFATGVEDREPVESITEYVPAEGGILYFFTELKNMDGTKVSHIWHKNGEEINSLAFNVGGARWRVNSSMKAKHFKAGDDITVEVMGDDGSVYESVTLKIR